MMEIFLNGKALHDPILYEQTTYILDVSRDNEISSDKVIRNYSSILKHLHGHLYALNVKNYIGSLHLLGQTFTVKSNKWEEGYVQQLWRAVSEEFPTLPFSAFRPTKQHSENTHQAETVRYQQWALARDRILYERGAINAWEWIAREPHQAMIMEYDALPVWKAKELVGSSWGGMTRSGNLEKLVSHHLLEHTALFRNLNRNRLDQGTAWFPKEVSVVKKDLTFDTKENRFIQMFLNELWELTEWMNREIRQKMARYRIHRLDDLRRENNELRQWLQTAIGTPWLKEVQVAYHIPQNSTVLQRRRGYRQWFSFYQEFMQGTRYPLSPSEFSRLLETREISKMFEYWCFFQVLRAIEQVTNSRRTNYSLSGDNVWGRYIAEGFHLTFTFNGKQGELWYNRTFKKPESYSVVLRPDISLYWDDAWYHFDAKYKDLETKDFLAEDLKKMHVYKDAIEGTMVAIALYPAEQVQVSSFYPSHNSKINCGVGSISLSVHENNEKLLHLVTRLLRD